MGGIFCHKTFEKVFRHLSKLSLRVFIKIDGEVSSLSIYEELYGISDRLTLSLAPAAGLVPPPKPALTIVWGGKKAARNVFCRDRRSTAVRSRSCSDTTPWCHSLHSRRFATPTVRLIAQINGRLSVRICLFMSSLRKLASKLVRRAFASVDR